MEFTIREDSSLKIIEIILPWKYCDDPLHSPVYRLFSKICKIVSHPRETVYEAMSLYTVNLESIMAATIGDERKMYV